MIDTTILGETAAKCMAFLDDSEAIDGGHIASVGIVVVAVDEAEEKTFVRTFTSEDLYYRQVGVFTVALECVREGYRSDGG